MHCIRPGTNVVTVVVMDDVTVELRDVVAVDVMLDVTVDVTDVVMEDD